MLLTDLIKDGTTTLSRLYPAHEAREMVLSYLETTLGTTRHTHILEPSYMVPLHLALCARQDFDRMADGEPLQYVVGKAYFYGREFSVNPSVLIPRPETEILCREVCNAIKNGMVASINPEKVFEPQILDLCTGSGCIAWTLALENPGAVVTALDVSIDALSVAAGQNFIDELHSTGARSPYFTEMDILNGVEFDNVWDEPYAFDIIVSNPPYVTDSEKARMRTNVLDYEPHLALFVPDSDPLVFYRAVHNWALCHLKPGGYGIVEINEALGRETASIFETPPFCDVRIIKDLSDKDRFVSFRRLK